MGGGHSSGSRPTTKQSLRGVLAIWLVGSVLATSLLWALVLSFRPL